MSKELNKIDYNKQKYYKSLVHVDLLQMAFKHYCLIYSELLSATITMMENFMDIKTHQLMEKSMFLIQLFNDMEQDIHLLFTNKYVNMYLMKNPLIEKNNYALFNAFINHRLQGNSNGREQVDLYNLKIEDMKLKTKDYCAKLSKITERSSILMCTGKTLL